MKEKKKGTEKMKGARKGRGGFLAGRVRGVKFFLKGRVRERGILLI